MDISEETLLLVNHGSRLYGLHREDSDYDTFRVVSTPPARNRFGDIRKKNGSQIINSENDDTVFDFKTFMIHAQNGVPQALEAMFAEKATIDKLGSFRSSYHVSVSSMAKSYTRQIEVFATGNYKRRRHAIRYALNLNEAVIRGGRFTPELASEDVDMLNELVMSSDYCERMEQLSFFQLYLDKEKIMAQIRLDRESN